MNIRINRHTENLKVGMKVMSDFYYNEKEVIRTILFIEKSNNCSSGYRAIADGGEVCPCCNRLMGTIIEGSDKLGVDASWFVPIGD
jgi:hypothetical protein